MNWKELKAAPPGERFERAYFANREKGQRGWKRAAAILGGSLLVAAGLFMLVAPGPGILVLIVGAALVAGESLLTARFLDRAEVRIRSLISTLRKNV